MKLTDTDREVINLMRPVFLVAAFIGGLLGGVAVMMSDDVALFLFVTATLLAAGAYDFCRRNAS